MGFFDFLRRRKNVSGRTTLLTDQAPKETLAIDAPRSATRTMPSEAPAPPTADARKDRQCQAVTAAGTQCQSAARGTSKYCGRHKGYRPTASVPANADTKPARADVVDTKPTKRRTAGKTANGAAKTANGAKTTKANGARTHFEHNGFRLYQKGNRYFFSKKAAKDVDGEPVREMPADRTIVTMATGLPVLKKK